MATSPYRARERVRRLFCNEMWNLGVIDQSAADIVRHGVRAEPRWLPPPPPGAILADPACRPHPDGSCTLYAEYLHYRRPIGQIWSAEIAADADPVTAQFQPLLVRNHHLSYPFPVTDPCGHALLTAESWQAGSAMLWRDSPMLQDDPTVLMAGHMVVDPTLWRQADRWWLFCTLQDRNPDGALYLFHSGSLHGPWTAHRANPVRVGRAGSRPAGPLFLVDGVLVRPGQDCSRTYGGAVILHAVTRLDDDGFDERPLRRIDPIGGHYGAGLHTFCPAGRYTVIDAKRWRIDLPGVPGKIQRSLLRHGLSHALLEAD